MEHFREPKTKEVLIDPNRPYGEKLENEIAVHQVDATHVYADTCLSRGARFCKRECIFDDSCSVSLASQYKG